VCVCVCVCVHIIVDESDGCGAKFSILVVAERFVGMPLIDRQVYIHTYIHTYIVVAERFVGMPLIDRQVSA